MSLDRGAPERNAGSNSSNEREPLAGLVERVTFHSQGNGFCVLAQKFVAITSALIRAQAVIEYALMEALTDGHCGLPEDELFAKAELLEIPTATLVEALAAEVATGEFFETVR